VIVISQDLVFCSSPLERQKNEHTECVSDLKAREAERASADVLKLDVEKI